MRKFAGPLLATLLLVAVGYGIYSSVTDELSQRGVVTVTCLTGSEKKPFFEDPRVIAAFAKHQLAVVCQQAGSREIATHPDLARVDFAFPAGVPAAEKIRQSRTGSHAQTPFFTPMAIASWQPIVDLLKDQGVVREEDGVAYLNLPLFWQWIAAGRRWTDLPGNRIYPANKRILLNSTDVRKSNSGAMYLALMSYIVNDGQVVLPETLQQKPQLVDQLADLFLGQGYVESSSQNPFEDYLLMGMGKAPLLMIYEGQFIGASQPETGGLPANARILYPDPGIFSKHVLVSFNDAGHRVGELLSGDPVLKQLANEHGFRNDQWNRYQDVVATRGIKLPAMLIDVIEPPSYEVIEQLIQAIEQKYR